MSNRVKAKRQQSTSTTDNKGLPSSQSTLHEMQYEGMFPMASETDKYEKIYLGFMAKTFEMAQQLQNHNRALTKDIIRKYITNGFFIHPNFSG